MPTFAYSGRTRTGQSVRGERIADTMDAAVAALRREQIMVTKIDDLKTPAKAEPVKKAPKGKSIPSKNLAIFTRQFSVMIDAGLPLVQCLEILGKQEPHKAFADYILRVRADVEAGAGLADAMKKHPKAFDALYSNMIAAGEAGGILDTILKRLAAVHREEREAEGAGQVGDDLPDRRHLHRGDCRRRHSMEGHSDLRLAVRGLGRPAAAAHARRHRDEQRARLVWSDHRDRARR